MTVLSVQIAQLPFLHTSACEHHFSEYKGFSTEVCNLWHPVCIKITVAEMSCLIFNSLLSTLPFLHFLQPEFLLTQTRVYKQAHYRPNSTATSRIFGQTWQRREGPEHKTKAPGGQKTSNFLPIAHFPQQQMGLYLFQQRFSITLEFPLGNLRLWINTMFHLNKQLMKTISGLSLPSVWIWVWWSACEYGRDFSIKIKTRIKFLVLL